MKTPMFIAGAIIFSLALIDNPIYFQYLSLRFAYRFGLPLYFRVFKVRPQANKFRIPRWQIEHWMVASGFSSPMAEKDEEGRYLFLETVSPLFRPFSLLMRGKISWDNPQKNVVVRGYATWSYFSILVLLVIGLLKAEGNICVGVVLFVYLLFCFMIYLYQMPHFYSIGERVVDYLSSHEE
ncbi:MAG TPA: hypothetical protein PLT08_15705 [Anaerolineales bacterium]|nr:hypothetical protein [Anaerolineales bacterium]